MPLLENLAILSLENMKNSNKTTIALVTEIKPGEFYSSLFHGLHVATRDSKSEIVFINIDAKDKNHEWSQNPVNFIIKLSKSIAVYACSFLA